MDIRNLIAPDEGRSDSITSSTTSSPDISRRPTKVAALLNDNIEGSPLDVLSTAAAQAAFSTRQNSVSSITNPVNVNNLVHGSTPISPVVSNSSRSSISQYHIDEEQRLGHYQQTQDHLRLQEIQQTTLRDQEDVRFREEQEQHRLRERQGQQILHDQQQELREQQYSSHQQEGQEQQYEVNRQQPSLHRGSLPSYHRSSTTQSPTQTVSEPSSQNSSVSHGRRAANGDSIPNSVDVSPRTTHKTVKPKRYSTPPIWAQKYRAANVHTHKGQSHMSNGNGAADSRSHSIVGSESGMISVSGLPMSMTGQLPFEDLTRKITEWVYSHLLQLGDDRKYVEVEFKLGTVHDKSTERRLELPIVTETLLRSDYAKAHTFFKAEMSDEQFNRANQLLDKLSGVISSFDDRPSRRRNMTSLSKLPDSKTRDVIYSSKSKAEKTRITYDQADNIIASISKRRISDLVIYSPGDLLDFRVSISVETPFEELNSLQRQRPDTIRNKNRQSFSQEGVQVDLTSVIYHNKAQNSSKELELELESDKLLLFFNSFQDKSDPKAMDKFEELIRLGVDNTRIVARRLSRES
ncbi:Cet1p [Sugiyamaella lignohabitans]|uniref:mRNA-capping enzyme subunit beta n=1 Tax=Sugiyamaella lignohabitans TaxID=796027 RepID=A0A167FWR6_9ASCO|nr:Cet1p [Sugiyamaella lignohabitans]ANB15799.1 Cet1p [Sugiyamaella lignohabitans]